MKTQTQDIMIDNCKHKYKIMETREGVERIFLFRYIRKVYVLRCTRCGLLHLKVAEFPLNSKWNTQKRRIQVSAIVADPFISYLETGYVNHELKYCP